MRTPSPISIYDNLPPSEPSISCRSTDVEFAGGVDHDLRVLEKVGRDNLLNHLFVKGPINFLIADRRIMLSRNEDVVDPHRLHISIFQFLVFNDDLRFAVRSEPRDRTVFSLDGHLLTDLVRQDV